MRSPPGGSRKRDLSERAETARFLVYSADSPFFWESMMLTGRLSRVRPAEGDEHAAAMDNAWHPDLFERAEGTGDLRVYTFDVVDKRGLKYTGLPDGFETAGERSSTA